MGYKMVFSDMDGTLLWKGTRISVENSAAIRKAVDKGVDFVICTGRGVFGVERFLEELGLIGRKGYVICQNGAAIYDLRDMKLVIRRSFPPAVIAPVAEIARKLGLEIYYYDDRRFFAERHTKRVERYTQVMGTNLGILTDPMDYDGEFTKCLFSGPKETLLKLKEKALPLIGEQGNLFFSSDIYLEFVRKEVTKGNALEDTAREAGVALGDVIAIGDSDNDLAMIERAGLGVAMKNGEPHVKAAADYITERTCDEDGVAEVIQKFILEK